MFIPAVTGLYTNVCGSWQANAYLSEQALSNWTIFSVGKACVTNDVHANCMASIVDSAMCLQLSCSQQENKKSATETISITPLHLHYSCIILLPPDKIWCQFLRSDSIGLYNFSPLGCHSAKQKQLQPKDVGTVIVSCSFTTLSLVKLWGKYLRFSSSSQDTKLSKWTCH